MSNAANMLHTVLLAKLSQNTSEQGTEDNKAPDILIQLDCSWSPPDDSPQAMSKGYSLVFLNVSVSVHSVALNDDTDYDESDGVKDLLAVLQAWTPFKRGLCWAAQVLVVVPMRSGFLARTKCFQQRFIGCNDLGLIHDRTIFGQRVQRIYDEKLQSLLSGSLLLIVRPSDHPQLSDDDSTTREVYARINHQWLLDHQPKPKTLAFVDCHLNIQSYLAFYGSATALGIRVVLLGSPQHWIRNPSMQHLYEDFITIDMTSDDSFYLRIATAVRAYGHVDGLCAIASYCLLPVAQAATMLGLPTENPEAIACAVNKHDTRSLAGGAEPTALVINVQDIKDRIANGDFIPSYPLIVKPASGTGSAHVYKTDTEAELLEAVKRTCEGSSTKALIEAYIDGPELDVNFVLLNGEIIFFEMADDFPSPGDKGTIDSDFWENTNALPSKLPAEEYAVVREKLHMLLRQMGLHTGVFHLEARIPNSSMAFGEENGMIDLLPRTKSMIDQAPGCFLIEVNPRPPGMPCIPSTAAAYGVNMNDLHILASVGDQERFRALAKPFDTDTTIPNHARAWVQLVWLRADQGGVCTADDVCEKTLQKLSPSDRELVTESVCFFRCGQQIPDPKQGVVIPGGFFVVTSRCNRQDVLRVSKILQGEFCIPCRRGVEQSKASQCTDGKTARDTTGVS